MKHTKSYILARSLKLFNSKGIVNVRLQHIADDCKISVGHLTYHFKHKDTLVEVLYDQLKAQQEVLLYDFRTAHLFEDINRQFLGIFKLQKEYIFFYLDTLEALRALPTIKEKHQEHIVWQIQQIEWMFEFNIFRNAFKEPTKPGQYKKLAWLFWSTMDNWMYACKISGADHLNQNNFTQDLWSLMIPYFTEEGEAEMKMLNQNSAFYFINPT